MGQKQPPKVFYKEGALKNFRKNSQENNSARVSFLIKLQALVITFELWNVNLAKILTTPFLQNTSGQLLLMGQFSALIYFLLTIY